MMCSLVQTVITVDKPIEISDDFISSGGGDEDFISSGGGDLRCGHTCTD